MVVVGAVGCCWGVGCGGVGCGGLERRLSGWSVGALVVRVGCGVLGVVGVGRCGCRLSAFLWRAFLQNFALLLCLVLEPLGNIHFHNGFVVFPLRNI